MKDFKDMKSVKKALADGISEKELYNVLEKQIAEAKQALEKEHQEKQKNKELSKTRKEAADAFTKYMFALEVNPKDKSQEEVAKDICEIFESLEDELRHIAKLDNQFNKIDNFFKDFNDCGKESKSKAKEKDIFLCDPFKALLNMLREVDTL